jgi:hypothetical protein
MLIHSLGKEEQDTPAVVGVEVRTAPLGTEPWVRSYGVIDGGLEVMRAAWPKLEHVFSVRRSESEEVKGERSPEPHYILREPHRIPNNLLNEAPVDLLTVERGFSIQPPLNYDRNVWEKLISRTELRRRPRVVLEAWPPNAQFWTKGPLCKSTTTRWHEMDYTTRCKRIDATKVGGAITQVRLMVVRVRTEWSHLWIWGPEESEIETPRPMSNLLTPPGLVGSHKYVDGRKGDPVAFIHPMPSSMGAYVQTERGTRRLMPEETSRGLGVPKEWKIDPKKISEGSLERTTSLFHWEHLSSTLSGVAGALMTTATRVEPLLPPLDWRGMRDKTRPTPATNVPFSWKPPDLREGKEWYQKRMSNLQKAAESFPNPRRVINEGRAALAIHRNNYTVDGPAAKQLKLLWWEFPEEHWESLKDGSRMNFLLPPGAVIHENAVMDEEQTQVAANFVDELMSLGAVQTPPEGRKVLTTAPLFVVPKEGQEGEWRVIADMLRGGQNECIAGDPVVLPRISHILDQMYTGGYSAVVDASKYFYQFPTHPDDRPFLGLQHPLSKDLLEYAGLPMGGANSPALACRYGLSFVRMLKERFDAFQGDPTVNCWWTGFTEEGYDPDLGYGFNLIGKDGGAVKIWAFVDDFLIHGPSYEKTSRALSLFLDLTVDCGMLCHPKKLTPPQQVVKYCGFLLDSRAIPCLRIPVAKRERALAIVEHLLFSPMSRVYSRLSLAVAAGILQSLVDATPVRLGHTYLRRFHSLVRPPGLGSGLAPYLTTCPITEEVKQDLHWWRQFLLHDEGRFARSEFSATLVPTWGDGSGTGTGGTFLVPGGPLKMWKGRWSPCVFKFSSNWKELSTLKLSLLRIKEEDAAAIRGTTVFYFTDNSTSYWIAASGSSPSPGLHKLIEEIRLLELELDCSLQVVHVPGLCMIGQGTDGLSRGIWMSALQGLEDSGRLTQAVFEPLQFDPLLVESYISEYGLAPQYVYCDWKTTWNARICFDQLSVWFPPPELARQVLIFMLETWAERPLTSSSLFFIPRTVPAFWWGLSRHLIELSTIYPHLTPLRYPPLLPIPVVVLYLPPHQRCLSIKDRLAPSAVPANAFWHRQQAALLRGLPPKSIG